MASIPHYIPNQEYSNAGLDNLSDSVHSAMEIAEKCPLEVPASHDLPPGVYACPEFMNFLSGLQIKPPIHLLDWVYDRRRTAQDILPFLYLGPNNAMRDKEFLANHGITLLLAIRDRTRIQAVTVNGDRVAADLGIESDYIEIDSAQELISKLPKIIRLINDHVCMCPAHQPQGDGRAKKVLVFCDTGNDRSACVIAAYFMAMLQTGAAIASSHVQVRRLSINIHPAFMDILKAFETILDAQRSIARNALDNHQIGPNGLLVPDNTISRKRSFEVTEESQNSDGEPMDTDHSLGAWGDPCRPSLPPFRDVTSI
ncbi:hypothetical protein MGYG_03573 [Nannizzia gypsea CBS 118893]|uniref:Tyrosine-protein phosphatase domain-containing protein n=1 Tax=Arthroderma gypseum (strain ATCC MYA-4604 / CBS 118893) TaxID=535722 RepID=E4USQ4_ARTGP|nr:hypothetical protein MGYG_03573 [Nannizzia gypsea CBS 118893]EFR00569.1 hypothetical protein MGYG_03573 [Nannizzia gypsea CBS 118893]